MNCTECYQAEREDGEPRRCKTRPCLVPPLDPGLKHILKARDMLIRSKNAGEIIPCEWILGKLNISLDDVELILLAEEEIRKLNQPANKADR